MSERDMRLETLAEWLENRDLPRGAKQAAADIRSILAEATAKVAELRTENAALHKHINEYSKPGSGTAAMVDMAKRIVADAKYYDSDVERCLAFLKEWNQ